MGYLSGPFFWFPIVQQVPFEKGGPPQQTCAAVGTKDNGGATPLFIVAQHGWLNAAKFLVLYKAEVDKALNTEATPMYVAAQNGHTELVSFLLESKANLDAQTTDGATPLFIASQMGHYGVVEMLLIAGSSFDIPNRTGAAALFIAAQQFGLKDKFWPSASVCSINRDLH